MGRNQIIEEKNEIKKTVKIPSSMLKISFCDFLRKYYFAKEIEIEKSTFKGYKNILENHIFPYFGKDKILFVNISSEEINKYLNFKIEKGFSSSTVKKHREVIGQALRTAYGKGWISTDIMASVDDIVPNSNTKVNKSISADVLDSILSIADGTDIYIPIMLSVRYGLDRSEILGLRWSDIDFDNREMHLRNVVIKGSKSAFDIHPIDEIVYRTLPAFETDLEVLSIEHQKQIKARSGNKKYCRKYYDYVNVTSQGYLLGPDNLSKKFYELLYKYHVEKITFSELRKAYAASLFSMGFNNKAVCSWMGVESISTLGCELNQNMVKNQIHLIKTSLELYRNGDLKLWT